MKEIEVTNFDLTYDGVYSIHWEGHSKRVCLQLKHVLKMLEIEGYTYAKVDELMKPWKPLHFSKARLVLWVVKETPKNVYYLTSEMAEDYQLEHKLVMLQTDVRD
jgi:hypothetical protein